MKYITFILILCSTTLFSQEDTTITIDLSKQIRIEGSYPKFECPEFRRTAGAVHADMKLSNSYPSVLLDNNGWLQDMSAGRVHKDTLFTTGKLYGPSINEPGEMITGAEFITTPYGAKVLGDGVYFRSLPPRPTDSTKFVRDIQLPQAWADSTEWGAPYDPNFYFHKNHEWVYSEFDDLNQEYQKLHPYPLGGFEHEGRICKVCKTKQQRTKYYGIGKNPFKKVITDSPYSQLLLQSRQ